MAMFGYMTDLTCVESRDTQEITAEGSHSVLVHMCSVVSEVCVWLYVCTHDCVFEGIRMYSSTYVPLQLKVCVSCIRTYVRTCILLGDNIKDTPASLSLSHTKDLSHIQIFLEVITYKCIWMYIILCICSVHTYVLVCMWVHTYVCSCIIITGCLKVLLCLYVHST